MASTGKKGKKNKGKGTAISLFNFLQNNSETSVGTTQVAKNIRNFDGDDSDDGGTMHTVVCQLPTAPRANRIFEDESIPHSPPFIAYVTNLPFDVNEDDIYDYFAANNVKSVRLPREDGETGRVRGFGYVEFESRDDLLQSLGIRDPTIKGRRIKIDLSNESDRNSRQRGPRRGNDSSGGQDNKQELSNWRRDNNTKKDQYSFGFERNFKDQKFSSDDNNSPGSWRVRSQNSSIIQPPAEQSYSNNRDDSVGTSNIPERPKLNLTRRTLPLPELEVPPQISLESKNNDLNSLKFSGVPAEKVFGSAKPVDTSAKDFEIEERLQKEISKAASDLKELSITKNDKIKNHGQNWRQQNENAENWKSKDKKSFRTDENIDFAKDERKKYQDKNEGYDAQKKKETKRKEAPKIKNEGKIDRYGSKTVRNVTEVAVTSNKYSGLDDSSE